MQARPHNILWSFVILLIAPTRPGAPILLSVTERPEIKNLISREVIYVFFSLYIIHLLLFTDFGSPKGGPCQASDFTQSRVLFVDSVSRVKST